MGTGGPKREDESFQNAKRTSGREPEGKTGFLVTCVGRIKEEHLLNVQIETSLGLKD